LPFEKDEQSVGTALMNLHALKSAYLPIKNIKSYKTQLYKMLMEFVHKDIPPSLKERITDSLFEFTLGDKEAEELGASWLESGFIHTK